MYCPKCLNDTLSVSSRGVVNLIVNGKQMDAGRFLFNLGKESPEDLQKSFQTKLEEFFIWYSGFKNKDPITRIEVCSGDFRCESGCRIDINSRFSVINILIPRKTVLKLLDELGQKYNLRVELKEN